MQRTARRQRTACEACRRRKIRCDIEFNDGGSCSVCAKSGLECLTRTHWPAPRRSKANRSSAAAPGDSSATQYSEPRLSPDRNDAAIGDVRQPSSHSGVAAHRPSLPSNDGPIESSERARSTQVTINSERPDELARTGLSRFFQDGVRFDDWHVFAVNGPLRLAYIGSNVSNLSHLVQLKLAHQTNSNGIDDINRATLHYPYPQIRPSPTWRPDSSAFVSHPSSSGSRQLSVEPGDVESGEDANPLPTQEVRKALIDAFFDHIYPTFPVVAKSHFFNFGNDPTWKAPPPLLYQAVMLAGAHICTHPLVARDRWMVKATLFRSASMLYHLRRETDRLYLMQAALLFTWHINDGDTVSGGPWYWAGIAVRLGHGQGTHRYNPLLPPFERVIHKRIWWSALVLEVFSSLEFGRPCSIQWEAIDQTLLTESDLDWGYTEMGVAQDPAWRVHLTSMTAYHVGMTRLARIGLEIIDLDAPGGSPGLSPASIDNHLATWSIRLGLTSPSQGEDFFSRQLLLHFNLLILYLHRSSTRDSDISHKACSVACNAIVNILDQSSAHGEFGRCSCTTVSAITAVCIHMTHDIRSSLEADAYLATVGMLDRLSQVLRYAKEMLVYWPHAEAVYNVFEGLRKEYENFIMHRVHQNVPLSIPESTLDWTEFFSMNLMDSTQHGEQNWLNLLS